MSYPPAVGLSLKGNSGALLSLMDEGGTVFVRKIAAAPKFSERLQGQYHKQKRFHQVGVNCPAVLDAGHIEDRFYFDMAYVSGESIAAGVGTGGLRAVGKLSVFLEQWLRQMLPTISGQLPRSTFPEKIARTTRACLDNPVLEGLYPGALTIATRLGALDWPDIPASDCHGDMTLENILIGSDGETYLIDFDVPDISSIWMDLGKLYQDVIGHWCIRDVAIRSPASLTFTISIQTLQRLQRETDAVVSGYFPEIMALMPQLAALNLFRTLPYCRDKDLADYVIKRISALII